MIERVIYTMKTDMVNHTEKTEMMRIVVEIEYVGKIADVFDKATGSFDDLQPEQVDLNYVHALNEPHLHEIRVVPDIGHKFAPFGRKSVKNLCSLKIVPISCCRCSYHLGAVKISCRTYVMIPPS
nr:hypothetical protein [Tanacetum cinerariifolium]